MNRKNNKLNKKTTILSVFLLYPVIYFLLLFDVSDPLQVSSAGVHNIAFVNSFEYVDKNKYEYIDVRKNREYNFNP